MEPTGFLNNLDKSRRIQLVWEKTYVSPYLEVEFSRVSQTNNSINSALRDSVCLLGFRLAITLGRKKEKKTLLGGKKTSILSLPRQLSGA